jgi:hypothetical protein
VSHLSQLLSIATGVTCHPMKSEMLAGANLYENLYLFIIIIKIIIYLWRDSDQRS